MAWQPAIPQPADFISQSQPLLLGNFQALDVWSKVDHSVISGINNGYHYRTTFVPQNLPIPLPTFPAGSDGLYCANPASVAAYPAQPQTGINELFITKQISAIAAATFPLTAVIGANGNVVQQGFFYLPSGLIVKYGAATMTNNPAGTPVVYTVAGQTFPVLNPGLPPVTFLQPIDAAIGVAIVIKIVSGSVSNLGFTAKGYNATDGTVLGGFNFFFISIGSA